MKSIKAPLVSIIILSKSANPLLFDCINSFKEKCTYPNYKIIIGDTGSTVEEKKEIKTFIKGKKIKLVEFDYYNFAKNNNEIVNNHIDKRTKLLLFCNNDVVLINDALTEMMKVYVSTKNTAGTIGARLKFKDDTIQHAGIRVFKFKTSSQIYFTHLGLQKFDDLCYRKTYDVIGNTGAFLLITKELFDKIGQFTETYISCFEDVELNAMCILEGKINYYCGQAACYHFESSTRNSDPEKNLKMKKDYIQLVTYLSNNATKEFNKYLEVLP